MVTLLPIDAITPRSLVLDPPLTDAEFEALCAANDLIFFERTREGEILMHSPTGGFTSRGNVEILGQLHSWWKTHQRGMLFDSNGGFFLPDSSMLSPDAAYVLPDKLVGLTRDNLTGFPSWSGSVNAGAVEPASSLAIDGPPSCGVRERTPLHR